MTRAEVSRRKQEPINVLLKRFKKRVNVSGHLQEYRDNRTYTKPTTARRKVKEKAIKEQERQDRGL